jgi:predicted Zn finger-like uncharacterized protein
MQPAHGRWGASRWYRNISGLPVGFHFVNVRQHSVVSKDTTRDSPMLIVCPSCTTSYQIDGATLGPSGRSVRCVRCRNVWFARDPDALSAIVDAHRSDVEALVGPSADAAAAEPPPVPAFDPGISADAPQGAYASPEVPTAEPVPASPVAGEAEPETMAAPALAPSEPGDPPTTDTLPAGASPTEAARTGPGEDIESFAARRARRQRSASSGMTALVLGILLLTALDAALVGWRAQVVKAAPQTASLYAAIGLPVNLRGLTFNDVKTTAEVHDGVQVLIVEGNIASVSRRTVQVPRLRFSVRNRSGQEVYAWTALPERSLLSPGETLSFRSRIASPPHDTRDILVRFLNRRDLVAGAR